MNTRDFDYLVIHGQVGWSQGHSLESVSPDNQGRLSLSSWDTLSLPRDVRSRRPNALLDCQGDLYRSEGPAFESKAVQERHVVGIAFDLENNLYVIDGTSNKLYRYCHQIEILEEVDCIGGDGQQGGQFKFKASGGEEYCGRIAFGRSTLYVSDTFNDRIQAFYLPSLQLRYILGGDEDPGYIAFSAPTITVSRPKDILVDRCGAWYVLDSGNDRILRFNSQGLLTKVLDSDDESANALQKPTGMAIDDGGYLYVLDGAKNSILRFDRCGTRCDDIGCFLDTDPPIRPETIAIGGHTRIYLGEALDCPSTKIHPVTRIHQLDATGRYLGYTDIEGQCAQLTADRKGIVYGVFPQDSRIVRFSGTTNFAPSGTYVSKVLDSKIDQCQWHRLLLDFEVPGKGGLHVSYYASDDPIDQKTLAVDNWRHVLSTPYKDININDALFEDADGRYLVLKFELYGDGHHTPTLKAAQVYFQRNSYLRYLPPTYQDDEQGRRFLERFLSIFESMSLDMEQKIVGVTQYWNVDSVPTEFLDWLGSWVAVFSDDNWPEDKKRGLLKDAFQLYKARGTQKGLRRVIEIFTGGDVRIIEHFHLRPPMVLGQASHIGMTSFVGPKPTTRLILEESSRIGDFVLVEDEDPPEKPFEHDAYNFTIIADTSALKDPKLDSALRRLIEAEKPAHTRYVLRTTQGAAAQLGSRSLLGVDTLLTSGQKPMRLGENSTVGTTTLLGTRQPSKGAIGVRSRIAVDAILY